MSLFLIVAVVCLSIAFTSGPMGGGYLFFITGIISFLIWAFLFIFGRYGKADDKKGVSKVKSGSSLSRSPVQVEFVVSDADTGQQVSSGSIGLSVKSQSAKQALADYEKTPTDLNFKRLFEATVVGDDPSQPGDSYEVVYSVLSKLGWGKLDAEDVTAELVSCSISGTSRKISDVVSDWCKLQLVKDGQYMYVYESWSGEIAQSLTEVAPQEVSEHSAVGDTEKDRMDRVSESWAANKPESPSASAKPAPGHAADREVTIKASIPFDTNDSEDVRNHGASARQLIEKLVSNGIFELELGEEISFGNFPTRLLCTNYEQRLDPTDNDSRIQKRSIAVNFFGVDSPVKVTAEIIRNSRGIIESKVTWTDAQGKNGPTDHPNWSTIKENLGLIDELSTASVVPVPVPEQQSSLVDFGAFADELVQQVKWAADKEDESYAGEVFKEKVNGFLTDAGIDIESKFSFESGYGDWIAAPDEVLIELITAIRQTAPFLNGEYETDAGIARIQTEIEDCLADNKQIEDLDPKFWAVVHE